MTCGVKMIRSVELMNNSVNFSSKKDGEKGYNYDTLLSNTPLTRLRIGADNAINAFTLYPAKGLKGNKNANFYEFLSMGTVPYVTGSLTLMAVFNSVNKHFPHYSKTKASAIGNKMALGVLFYALMKGVSKSFISKPIQMMTGVDIERPYAKVIYELPDDINDTDIISIEHHKVFESVEFPRWDLLYGDEAKGQKKNYRYDKIAKKLGLGKNLNDSDQEVKPRIKEIVIKANLAKNISSYLWAACGVALAFQKPWDKFFRVMSFNIFNKDKFMKSLTTFKDSFIESSKALYKGEGKGIRKHAGKIVLGMAAASTVLGLIGTMSGAKKASAYTIKEGKGYTKA